MRTHRTPGDRARMELDLSRIRAFSDGVLAISITLLVLNIEVPILSKQSLHELPVRLLELGLICSPTLWASLSSADCG